MTKFLLTFLFLIASYSFGQKMNGISVNGEKYAPDFSNFSYLKKTNANWVSVQSFGFIKSTTSGLRRVETSPILSISFEAIFLKMFLDQARQSKLSDDILGSSASDNFQEMFDSEL